MPRGGRRAGSGRKKGSANVKSRQIADEAAASGATLPLQHLLGILNDPKATQARKDWAAGCAAGYCHPRLSATATASLNAPGAPAALAAPVSADVPIEIWALPRGAQMGKNGQVEWPDGTVTDAPVIQPYEPTPDWTRQPALTHQPEPEAKPELEPLEVIETVDDGKVVRLDPFRDRDDQGPPDAA